MKIIILSYIVVLMDVFEFIKYERKFDDFILINNDFILIKSEKSEFNNKIKVVKILFIEKSFNYLRIFLIKLSNSLKV